MVKKANGKWRICIDYTDLNQACSKDSFPLSKIDQLVDATSGHRLFSFMDAFARYNQIRMAPEDEEHTAFVTAKGFYYYKVMPFDLKNAEPPTIASSIRSSKLKSGATWRCTWTAYW